MPKLRQSGIGRDEEVIRLPMKVLQLRQWPSRLREQCQCDLCQAMADFCQFAIGEVTLKPFVRRSSLVFSNLGEALARIASGLRLGNCDICSGLHARLGDDACRALSSSARSVMARAGDRYAAWLSRYMEGQIAAKGQNAAGGMHLATVDSKRQSFYRQE